MAEQAENQEVTTSAPESIKDMVFGKRAPNPTLDPAIAQVPSEVIETPAPAAVPVADVKDPVAEVVRETPKEVDPYEAILNGDKPKEPVAWDDNSIKTFKDFFGAEDPKAFKDIYEATKTERDIVKAEQEKWEPIRKQIDALPPTQAEALRLMLQGKTQEAQDYIRNTPDIVLQNKEAKNIDSQKLIETYFPGKMTKEQFEAIKDPDTDPDIVEALTTKRDLYREMATEKHEAQRKSIADRAENEAQENTKRWEKYQAANVATISQAKQSPLGVFVDKAFTDEITSGKFLSRYVQEDGVTPTLEGATLLLKGLHYDKVVEAARKSAVREAKIEGKLEAVSEMHTGPKASRDAGGTPNNTTKSLKDQILERI